MRAAPASPPRSIRVHSAGEKEWWAICLDHDIRQFTNKCIQTSPSMLLLSVMLPRIWTGLWGQLVYTEGENELREREGGGREGGMERKGGREEGREGGGRETKEDIEEERERVREEEEER